jgi:hypothetical protein
MPEHFDPRRILRDARDYPSMGFRRGMTADRLWAWL